MLLQATGYQRRVAVLLKLKHIHPLEGLPGWAFPERESAWNGEHMKLVGRIEWKKLISLLDLVILFPPLLRPKFDISAYEIRV